MTDGSNVVGLHGGPVGGREVSEEVIKCLEEALEMARSGEIRAVVISFRYFDDVGGYAMSGDVGGFALVGSAHMALQHLSEVVRGEV